MNESLLPAQRLAIARNPQRPGITDYIDMLFTDFVELRGDRLCGEDPAILGGVALFHGAPVTVIGTRKGKTLEENVRGVSQGPAADAPGGEISPPRPHVHRYLRRLSRHGGGGTGTGRGHCQKPL